MQSSTALEEARVGASNSEYPGETLMHLRLLRGGRKLGHVGGGTLYEVPSKYEDEENERQAQAFWEPQTAPGWQIKSSVEASRTRTAKAFEDFPCEGTMYRHTLRSWADAPCEFQSPHEVKASEDDPVNTLLREYQIEDLTPFERDVCWVTVWRKCEKCYESDAPFKEWVARRQ